MTQTKPSYGYMTSSVSELITKPLIQKYGPLNVVNPIVIINGDSIVSYVYENTQLSKLNQINSNKPKSISNKSNFFLDYTVSPRIIFPSSEQLKNIISKEFNCCYEFILKQDLYNSVDIDYAWFNGSSWKGIELTTLYTPLINQCEAERLVKMFTRRPSWSGPNGPHGIYTLIEAATDLSIEYYFVLVNSKKGVSNDFDTKGNSYWFPLTSENIKRILNNSIPVNAKFGTYEEMLNWL